MSDRTGSARVQRPKAGLRLPTAWPFYVIYDVSESMWHSKFHHTDYTPWHVMRDGLADLLAEIDFEPSAKDCCHLSVVAFSDQVEVILPLTPMSSDDVNIGALPQGGTTDYALVFDHLANQLARDYDHLVQHYSLKRPVVYFVTDGAPFVNGRVQPDAVWVPPLQRLHAHESQPIVVALGLGTVEERALATVRAAPGPACVAEAGVSPGELLRAIVGSIIKSVINSSGRDEFLFDIPAGMRRLA